MGVSSKAIPMRAFIAPVGTLHSTVPAELQTPLISEARPTRKTREKKTRVFWKIRGFDGNRNLEIQNTECVFTYYICIDTGNKVIHQSSGMCTQILGYGCVCVSTVRGSMSLIIHIAGSVCVLSSDRVWNVYRAKRYNHYFPS